MIRGADTPRCRAETPTQRVSQINVPTINVATLSVQYKFLIAPIGKASPEAGCQYQP